jgi:class 3 adenylate cyclase
MVTDAVGFSARMSVDEEQTLTLIHRDQQCMQQLCQQYEGRVLKSTGDGLLMYFASAVQAVSCGLQIQRELVALHQPGGRNPSGAQPSHRYSSGGCVLQ